MQQGGVQIEYCLEYMVTGLHYLQSFNDCFICSKRGFQQPVIFENNEDKNDHRINLGDPIKDEDFQDELQQLENAVDEDDGNVDLNNLTQEQKLIEKNVHSITKQITNTIGKKLANETSVLFLLDNSMGQIPIKWRFEENRLSYAIQCLSHSLENLKETQLFNISSIGKAFQKDQVAAQNDLIQEADEFFSELPIYANKNGFIDLLQNSIVPSQKANSLYIITDFSQGDFVALEQQISAKLQQKSIQLHIFEFNILGSESKEQREAASQFWERVAQLSNGSYTPLPHPIA